MAVLIPFDPEKWNPVEDGPVCDDVPRYWIASHVGKRLAEAFETLRRMPMPNGPREFGRAWPSYRVEWADLLAQEEDDREAAKQREQDRNTVRLPPSAEQVGCMERAIAWPARFLKNDRPLLIAVQRVALSTSIGRDLQWVVRKWGGYEETWQTRNWAGCARIADGLCADGDPVF